MKRSGFVATVFLWIGIPALISAQEQNDVAPGARFVRVRGDTLTLREDAESGREWSVLTWQVQTLQVREARAGSHARAWRRRRFAAWRRAYLRGGAVPGVRLS